MLKGSRLMKKVKTTILYISIAASLSTYFCFVENVPVPNLTFRRIKSLTSPTNAASSSLVAWFKDLDKTKIKEAGGKGSNLGELSKIAGVPVPAGFVITASSYRNFLAANPGLKEDIIRIFNQVQVKNWSNISVEENGAINEASREVKGLILRAKMPEEVKNEILRAYRQLGGRVAVRSSATAEDLDIKAFAGAQDTYLNVHGENAVLGAVQADWASLFNPSAIVARGQVGISITDADMAVIIQKMVENGEMDTIATDRGLSGTGFTMDPDTGWRPGITTGSVALMEWGYGLGESMVSGKQRGDRLLIVKNPQGEWKVIGKEKGYPKGRMVVFSSRTETDPRRATQWLNVPEELASQFSVSEQKAIETADIFEKIYRHYGKGMDIEFAVDKDGKVWITQARAETKYNKISQDRVVMIWAEVPEDAADSAVKLLQGDQGTGAAVGRVVKIAKGLEGLALQEALSKLGPGDILIAEATTPDMEPAMARAGAIVAVTGGVTSHAAIVGRELGKPVIVGAGEHAWELEEGQQITVDANRGLVYEGILPLVEVSQDYSINDLAKTRTKVGLVVANPAQARRMSALGMYESHGGVNLLRAEFALARMQMHPMAFLEYDNGKLRQRLATASGMEKKKIQELLETIEIKIKGYRSGTEYYKEQLAQAIAQVAALQKPEQYMIYRTTDFKSNEYRQLVGGWLYEDVEPNPMLGYRGEGRMIHPNYQELFAMEVEAIKRARETYGYKNIEVMLPVVRTPEELQRTLNFMARHGLRRGVDGLRIGIMVEVPSNVFFLDKFLEKGVDFISIGSNDLAQFGLAVGRDSEHPAVKKIFNMSIRQPEQTAIVSFLETIIRGARFFGVKSGICGAAPSVNPEYARYLVEFGIDSVGVEPKAYKGVSEIIAEVEKRTTPASGHWPFFEGDGSPNQISLGKVKADDIIKELGVHPEVIPQHTALREEAINTIYKRIQQEAKKAPGKMVVYETTEMTSVDYTRLKDGQLYESPDFNPKLGFLGLVRVLSTSYFDLELEAIKKARDEGINVGIKFNMVRVPGNLEEALVKLREAGLGDITVGIGVDNPAVLVDLYEGKFKDKIQFLELSQDDQAQLALYTFSADPDSPMAPLLPKGEINQYLLILGSLARAAAQAYGYSWATTP